MKKFILLFLLLPIITFAKNVELNGIIYRGYTDAEVKIINAFVAKSRLSIPENSQDLATHYSLSVEEEGIIKKFLSNFVKQNYVFEGKEPTEDIAKEIFVEEEVKSLSNDGSTVSTKANKAEVNPVYLRLEDFKSFTETEIIDYYIKYIQKNYGLNDKDPRALATNPLDSKPVVPLLSPVVDTSKDPLMSEKSSSQVMVLSLPKETRKIFFTFGGGVSNNSYLALNNLTSNNNNPLSYLSDTSMFIGLDYAFSRYVLLTLEGGIAILHYGDSDNYFYNIIDSIRGGAFEANIQIGLKLKSSFVYLKPFFDFTSKSINIFSDTPGSRILVPAIGVEVGASLSVVDLFTSFRFPFAVENRYRGVDEDMNLKLGVRFNI